MWGFLVIPLAAITSVLGHSDESALLQTKSSVHKHTDTQACQTGDVKAADIEGQEITAISSGTQFYPYVQLDSDWYPICGHYFWSNDLGATILCKDLGFTSGVKHRTLDKFAIDAMPVGSCLAGEALTDCTAGGNAWGDFNWESGSCKAGMTVGIKISCTGGATHRTKSCEDVVEVTGDPHMRNLKGEVFDLFQEGKHVLIQIPAGSGEDLEVIGSITAFHKTRKCPKFFMTQIQMKGSMVGDEPLRIVSDPDNFGVKLGTAREFLKIGSGKPVEAGAAKVQRCNEETALCQSISPGRRTPNFANKVLVQLSSISLVASNYASANPSFLNLAISGLAAQHDVGGLLGQDDHSHVVPEAQCDTLKSGVQKVSMLQKQNFNSGRMTVGHVY